MDNNNFNPNNQLGEGFDNPYANPSADVTPTPAEPTPAPVEPEAAPAPETNIDTTVPSEPVADPGFGQDPYDKTQSFTQPQQNPYGQQPQYNQNPYGQNPYPQQNGAAPEDKSTKYIIFSILEILFCGGIFGVIALIFAILSKSAYNKFDYQDYESKKKTSKILLIIGLVLGLLIYVVTIVFVVIAYRSIDELEPTGHLVDDFAYEQQEEEVDEVEDIIGEDVEEIVGEDEEYEEWTDEDWAEFNASWIEYLAEDFTESFEDAGYDVYDQSDEYATEGIMYPFISAEKVDRGAVFIGFPDDDYADDCFDGMVENLEVSDADGDGFYTGVDSDGVYYMAYRYDYNAMVVTFAADEETAAGLYEILYVYVD